MKRYYLFHFCVGLMESRLHWNADDTLACSTASIVFVSCISISSYFANVPHLAVLFCFLAAGVTETITNGLWTAIGGDYWAFRNANDQVASRVVNNCAACNLTMWSRKMNGPLVYILIIWDYAWSFMLSLFILIY